MKAIIKIFICLSLIYTPFFAFASAAEKWEVLENNYYHVSNKVKIEARKITQDAANSGRYKVEVPVSPAALGKTVKTMMWTGVAVAGVQAMLEGIGWVIDVGSQTIFKEKESKGESMPPDSSPYSHLFYGPSAQHLGYFTTLSAAASAVCSYWGWGGGSVKNKIIDGQWIFAEAECANGGIQPLVGAPNPDYDPYTSNPPPAPERIYLSDSELGNEILGNGENTQPLPDAVEQAYSPNNPVTEPAPEATRQALDNANPQPDEEPKGESETEPEIDPETGEATGKEKTTFELPNFCSWAPAVCDFFTVQKADNKEIKKNQREQIEQDKTFFEKVAEWFDWSQADDQLPDNESPDIVEHVTPDLREDAISWGSACPADVSIPISMQGVSSTLVFSWSPWCQLLSIIKPAIVASAYIGAAFIVLGLRT